MKFPEGHTILEKAHLSSCAARQVYRVKVYTIYYDLIKARAYCVRLASRARNAIIQVVRLRDFSSFFRFYIIRSFLDSNDVNFFSRSHNILWDILRYIYV